MKNYFFITFVVSFYYKKLVITQIDSSKNVSFKLKNQSTNL